MSVGDHRRPWIQAIPEKPPARCRPFWKENVLVTILRGYRRLQIFSKSKAVTTYTSSATPAFVIRVGAARLLYRRALTKWLDVLENYVLQNVHHQYINKEANEATSPLLNEAFSGLAMAQQADNVFLNNHSKQILKILSS
ncbi:hypothetical protein EVAR_9816_1 [Eumeta japonica]|uniref:Uncharacterized protein n=1 Tax=Eumeta variegata TaxID=151549 RepID=A0A4C1U5M9_EUMVA|nr:hypothetical protein EVAR_9816_1 [Eumeta japonica]